MPEKIRVALLFGGRSAEHEVSVTSAAAVYGRLDKTAYPLTSIYINRAGLWKPVESPLLPLEELNRGRFFSFLPWNKGPGSAAVDADIYFPVLHGPFGEDGTIQGLLELADVPFVGAAVLASAAGMDKAIAKTLFAARRLPVVKHRVLLEGEWRDRRDKILDAVARDFPPPFYVKPANLGSSVGITKVISSANTVEAVESAFTYDRKILIEEGVTGREIECSVLGHERFRASLPGEVIPFREFYDYRDKYIEGKTRFGIPAELPPDAVEEIQRISIEAFRAIDGSGMARVDFFIQERTEKIFLNEINTIPGFTEISMYPKLWEASGLAFDRLLGELIACGMERHRQRKRNLEWA